MSPLFGYTIIEHIDQVFDKVMVAQFATEATQMLICFKTETKYLWFVISEKGGVSPEPEKDTAMRSPIKGK